MLLEKLSEFSDIPSLGRLRDIAILMQRSGAE
jgi:hypothetical protein